MSEVVSDNEQQASGELNDKPETVSRTAYEKLLAETKKERLERRALEERLKLEEDKKLSEQSQFKELAEKYKRELDAEKQRLQKVAKNVAKKEFSTVVKQKALELGANPAVIDDLIKVGDWSGIDVQEQITDEDVSFSVDASKVTEALARMQKEKPIYFTKTATAPRDVVLGNGTVKPKDLNEMSREDIIKQLKQLG